ncbi:MAG: hypothetical protein IIC60_08430 [Proteobacteria bacterium]|nr:hypothetical protein [Pseudomonadota bacterium]
MRAINHKIQLSTASLLALTLASYLYAAPTDASEFRDISKINGGIRVAAAEQVGDISSINGGVDLALGASAYAINTVNGGIYLHDQVIIVQAETVNGSIRLGEDVSVNGSLFSVNGSIRTNAGTVVENRVRTVNGKIQLLNTQVGGDVQTSNGDIILRHGSVIAGDVVIRGRHSWWERFFGFNRRPSDLTIDASSSVKGDIHLYRRVNLQIDDGAEIGDIIEHF